MAEGLKLLGLDGRWSVRMIQSATVDNRRVTIRAKHLVCGRRWFFDIPEIVVMSDGTEVDQMIVDRLSALHRVHQPACDRELVAGWHELSREEAHYVW